MWFRVRVPLPYITTKAARRDAASAGGCARCRRPSRLAPRALHGRRVARGASRGRRSGTSRSGPRAASSSTTHLQCSSTKKLPHDSFLSLGSTIGNCCEPTNFRFQIWHPERCIACELRLPFHGFLWSMSRPFHTLQSPISIDAAKLSHYPLGISGYICLGKRMRIYACRLAILLRLILTVSHGHACTYVCRFKM